MKALRGFTLVELVTVMVILSVIAVMGSHFVVSSTNAYNQTQNRAKLINTSRQALERITRQLRGALPNSVRATNGGACVEFLPLAAGGYYRNPVPDAANGAAGSASINTTAYRIDFGNASYAVIGALSPGDIYGGGSLAALSTTLNEGASATGLNLSSAKVWQRNSVQQRFYLVDNPQAFCVSGTDLRFYSGYGTPITTTGVPSGAGVLMAENVSSAIPFVVDNGTETRNTILAVDLTFAKGGESVNFSQEVHIRNVP